VNVRRAISKVRCRDGAHKWEWQLGLPKSRKASRRIAATESVMHLLADLQAVQEASTFLFPHAGTFIDPDKFDADMETDCRTGEHAWNQVSRPAPFFRLTAHCEWRDTGLRS